ncbi:MAG: hypothetical protein AABW80_00050 [Nanoarchaeota archaeon]
MKKEKSNKELNSLPNYEEGFNVLMDYWDFIPIEDRHQVDKKLKKFGL